MEKVPNAWDFFFVFADWRAQNRLVGWRKHKPLVVDMVDPPAGEEDDTFPWPVNNRRQRIRHHDQEVYCWLERKKWMHLSHAVDGFRASPPIFADADVICGPPHQLPCAREGNGEHCLAGEWTESNLMYDNRTNYSQGMKCRIRSRGLRADLDDMSTVLYFQW